MLRSRSARVSDPVEISTEGLLGSLETSEAVKKWGQALGRRPLPGRRSGGVADPRRAPYKAGAPGWALNRPSTIQNMTKRWSILLVAVQISVLGPLGGCDRSDVPA